MTNKKKIEEMIERELIFTLLSDKVGSVDPKNIFFAKRIDQGKNAGTYACLLGGKKISANQIANLRAEAATLQSMSLWKIFTETLSHEAQLRMFKHAKTDRDLDWGKAILHSVSIFETLVEAIRNAELSTPVE